MGDVPALGEHTEALPPAVGMTDDETAALCRDGVAAQDLIGRAGPRRGAQCLRPPNSERRSRRRGANSETRAVLLRA